MFFTLQELKLKAYATKVHVLGDNSMICNILLSVLCGLLLVCKDDAVSALRNRNRYHIVRAH